jgi:hypothetical protein
MCSPCDNVLTTLSDNTLCLDFAVLSQTYKSIKLDVCQNHVIELDPINISLTDFLTIFYPFGDSFGINLQKMNVNQYLLNYVSFLPLYRTFKGKNFSLLENIILNIEADLNVSRNCFTTSSLIDLSKELSEIQTLCDINCCSVLSSLSWSNIINRIKNEQLTRVSNAPLDSIALVLSIVFVTPHDDILETIIKFTYLIDISTISL